MILIDIETIPTGERELPKFPLKPTREDVKIGNTKDADKIKALIDTKLPEMIEAWEKSCSDAVIDADIKYRKRALIPHKCQVVCWAVKTDSKELCVLGANEKELIGELDEAIKELCQSPYQVEFVGVNIRSFDLVILKQRAWKYNYPSLSIALNQKHFDIMDVFTGSRDKSYLVSKDDMCEFFGIPVEGDSGSEVYQWWTDAEYEKISNHCINDVRKEYELYKKINV